MYYPNAAEGLRKMFYAQIIAIVSTVVVIIPFLGWIGAIVGYVACLVFQFSGLNLAARDDGRYKTALYLAAVNMVISVINSFLQKGLVNSFFSFAGSVLSLISLYIVISTTTDLLERSGRSDVASTGKTVWILNVISLTAAAVVLLFAILAVVGLSMTIAALSGITVLAAGVISIVAGIMYIVFLNKASKAL